ncbi:hypothetical protein L596_013673 [Steinernema carpocapsae]|uniref:Uncharacterized protein n=1 Tax=Steinernema carpocapsae TaxID=34508 RepID=A0A4U5P1S8_STECR|nr:hypothetical protein L596_013673 [Steinernema carpocapsae]
MWKLGSGSSKGNAEFFWYKKLFYGIDKKRLILYSKDIDSLNFQLHKTTVPANVWQHLHMAKCNISVRKNYLYLVYSNGLFEVNLQLKFPDDATSRVPISTAASSQDSVNRNVFMTELQPSNNQLNSNFSFDLNEFQEVHTPVVNCEVTVEDEVLNLSEKCSDCDLTYVLEEVSYLLC